MDPRLCFFYEQCMNIIKYGGDKNNINNRKDAIIKLLEKCKNPGMKNMSTSLYDSKKEKCISFFEKYIGHNNKVCRVYCTAIISAPSNENWNDIKDMQNAVSGEILTEESNRQSNLKIILIDHFLDGSKKDPFISDNIIIDPNNEIKCRTNANYFCILNTISCAKNFLPSYPDSQLLLCTKCGCTNVEKREDMYRENTIKIYGLSAQNRNNTMEKLKRNQRRK